MKINRLIKITLIVVTIVFLVGFVLYKIVDFGFKQPCPPPNKPEGIPTEAIWNGGCDGGYWISLVDIKENKYRFRIYLDYKAEILMDADYILRTKNCNDLPKDSSILSLISVVEVDMISINKEGKVCTLEPVYPAYGGSSWEVMKEKGEY